MRHLCFQPSPSLRSLSKNHGQGLSVATGYQDKFSWKQVGISALGAGISSGLGYAFNGAQGGLAAKAGLATKGTNTAAAINAGVNSVATQGVLLATGLQEKFDWKSVAASAVTAAVSNQISKSIYTVGVDDSGNPIRKLSSFTANNPKAADFTTRDQWCDRRVYPAQHDQ